MLVRRGVGAVPNPAFGDYTTGMFAPANNVAAPPAPPQSLWTVAPGSGTEAQQVVQDISNQQMSAQQAADARGVQQSGGFLDLISRLTPNFLLKPADSASPSSSSCGFGCAALWLSAAGFVVALFMTRRRA